MDEATVASLKQLDTIALDLACWVLEAHAAGATAAHHQVLYEQLSLGIAETNDITASPSR